MRKSFLFLLWSQFGIVMASAFVTPSLGDGRLENVVGRATTPLLAVRGKNNIPTSKEIDSEPLLLSSVTDRRNALLKPLVFSSGLLSSPLVLKKPFADPANAYTPDSDHLRESLYLICRVQEATCLQERYIEKSRPPIQKMKLTLRLVDKSYRLLDQVNFISKNIQGNDVVVATQLGNEAADALQEAIDFVYEYASKNKAQDSGAMMTLEQRDFLKASLTECREKLFDFVEYLPPADQIKLLEARKRVEDENNLNKDEFDPDLATDAGVYNPVTLPWKTRPKKVG